jgi:hypothetical protein
VLAILFLALVARVIDWHGLEQAPSSYLLAPSSYRLAYFLFFATVKFEFDSDGLI